MRFGRFAGERGTTLVEVLTALVLTVATASALLGLAAGSARTVVRVAADDPRVDVTIEALTRDLRAARSGAAIATDGSVATTLEIATATETVRWVGAAGAISRQVLPDGDIRTMVDRLDKTRPLVAQFLTSTGTLVAPNDPEKVKACTRRVRISIIGPDGVPLHDRSVSMRAFVAEAPAC